MRTYDLLFVGAALIGVSVLMDPCEEPLDPIMETCPMVCQAPAPDFEDMESGIFVATGYAIGPPYASIVRSGQPVVNKGFMSVGDIELFTVAVDPKVIPLGSVLWIEDLGLGMASDTGRLIKGRRIDVCFTTMREAWYFGRKDVKVVMLRSGRSERR